MSNKYAQFIKALRTKRGFSQLVIAEKLAISRASYIAIERGKRDLTMAEFEKLSGVFGVSFDEIESGESPNYEKYKEMILA
ncbi:MAG: helix-turn-helix transcriptional regulator, partial [Patescibacteria group bacterium]